MESPPLPTFLIERLVPGGEGMTRLADGRVAFAPGVVPGDIVRPRRTTDRRGFVRFDEVEVVQPSLDRRGPPCPLASVCGGCDWMMMNSKAQLDARVQLLFQALERTGRFDRDDLPAVTVVESRHQLGYRSRVRLHVEAGRVGYFSRKSRTLVEFSSCLVASKQLAQVISFFKAQCLAHPKDARQLDQVELRALDPSDEASLHPSTCAAHLRLREGASGAVLALSTALETGLTVRTGDQRSQLQELPMVDDPELKRLALPGGFSQVNLEINQRMVRRILHLAKACGARTFLDVFCGSGNFSLPLLKMGLTGLGVEQSSEAVAAAREGARVSGLHGEFLAGPAAKLLRHNDVRGRHFDFAVVDPPRAGAKEIMDSLVQLRVPTIAMISCDPVTLARDLRLLFLRGYQVQSLELYDMFPQTHHFETVAVVGSPSAPA